MKNYILFLFFLMISFLGYSQTFTTKIIDKDTQLPLPLVNVYAPDFHVGTVTDEAGEFTFEGLPKKTIEFHISYIGYQTRIEKIDLSSINTLVFELEAYHLELEEVMVSVPIGKLQQENITHIERKKIETLKQTNPINLAEAISSIPGVDL